MVSYKLRMQRVGNTKNSFKKYAIKSTYGKVNTLANETLNLPAKCEDSKTITNCSGDSREAYCNGRVFRNPLSGYKKTTVSACYTDCSGVKLQEIYKDPYSKSCGTSCYYDRRIRTMNNKNGQINRNYNYDYGQYLRNRCKTFKQNEFRFLNNGGTYRSNCTNTDLSCNTYKMKNSKFSENSAVTSSSRLVRLKYNTILAAQKNNCKNGEVCGVYTSNTNYKDKNLEPNVTTCSYRRIAGVLRKTCGR